MSVSEQAALECVRCGSAVEDGAAVPVACDGCTAELAQAAAVELDVLERAQRRAET